MMGTTLTEHNYDVVFAEDDDEDFMFFTEAIAELELKIVLTRAENGDILMKILHEKIPDLLFLDIVMPWKDGKTCLREIRSDKQFDNLPIIMYSSVRDLETIEFCYRQGTNLFFMKPGSYAAILEALRKIFAIDWKQMRYYPTFSEFVLNPEA